MEFNSAFKELNPILPYIYTAVLQLVVFFQVCPTKTRCISVLSFSSIAPDSNIVTICGIPDRITFYLKSGSLHTLVRKLLQKLLPFVQQKQSPQPYASVMYEY
jgi:hypothetical protein